MAVAEKNRPAQKATDNITPNWHQGDKEIQAFGTVVQDLPLGLSPDVRMHSCTMLNELLADTLSLRDMYKKHHWQVAGPTFYQLHLLFDKHFDEQVDLADEVAERIQLLGGVTVAMARDVAALSKVQAPPQGREEVPAQISRLLDGHKVVIGLCHEVAKKVDEAGDDGTNDLVISSVLRRNELQAWFIMQHLVEMPLVKGN